MKYKFDKVYNEQIEKLCEFGSIFKDKESAANYLELYKKGGGNGRLRQIEGGYWYVVFLPSTPEQAARWSKDLRDNNEPKYVGVPFPKDSETNVR